MSLLRLARPVQRSLRPLTRSIVSLADDPFPLPFSPNNPSLASPSQGDSLGPMPQPIDRTGESLNAKRARLVYQSRKRGILETDLLLSTFAKDNLSSMTLEELDQYDKLLDEPDWDIFYWSLERKPAPERWANTTLLAKLRKHARNEEKTARRMPELKAHAESLLPRD